MFFDYALECVGHPTTIRQTLNFLRDGRFSHTTD